MLSDWYKAFLGGGGGTCCFTTLLLGAAEDVEVLAGGGGGPLLGAVISTRGALGATRCLKSGKRTCVKA